MKILPVEKIREADAFTIENEPVDSVDLMERAANELCKWFVERCEVNSVCVKIFCGMGNNGGDGLALARLLSANDIVSVFMLRHSEKMSHDCEINFNRLKNETDVQIREIFSAEDFPFISDDDIIIDAIFGSGLNKSVNGIAEELIKFLNNNAAVRIAVDMPSGLYADKPVQKGDTVFRADYTLSFQSPKLAFMFPENDGFVGNWEVLDIKLHHDFMENVEVTNFYTTDAVVKPILKKRSKFSHKGTYGHALLIAGSDTKTGAALLSAEACLRTGVGLLSVHLPQEASLPLMAYLPEAMLDKDKSKTHCTEINNLLQYSSIAMGPGVGKEPETANVLKKIIQEAYQPLVLDADALNILSENPTWISFLPHNTILTPHPKEFERLFGKTYNSFERLELQRDMSVKHGIIIVLKGAHTSISFPNGSCFFNSAGNPGMATAGSGDVLTGVILSLLAQHYTPEESALLGVYLHSKAADFAVEQSSEESMIASDISKNIYKVFRYLREM